MPKLSKAEIDAIRELDKARTQGKWEAGLPQWRRYGPPYKAPVTAIKNGVVANVLDHRAEYVRGLPAGPLLDVPADAAFIAACSEAIPNLLDTIDAYRRVLKFYANKNNYETPRLIDGVMTWPVLADKGQIAREALAAQEEEKDASQNT